MKLATKETRVFWMRLGVTLMHMIEGHPAWPRRPRPSVLLGREVRKASKAGRETTDADYARYLRQR